MPRLLELRNKVAPTVIRIPGVPRLLGLRGRRRRSWTIQHYAKRRPAVTARVVADKARPEEDVAIATRLLAAYGAATREAVAASGIARICGPRYRACREGSWQRWIAASARARRILVNVSRRDAATGISQGDVEFARIRRDRSYRAFLAPMTVDKLVSLAEGVGAVAVENPEGGRSAKAFASPPGCSSRGSVSASASISLRRNRRRVVQGAIHAEGSSASATPTRSTRRICWHAR